MPEPEEPEEPEEPDDSEGLLLEEPLPEELPPSEPDEDEPEELDSDLAAPSELAEPSDPFFAAPGATLPLLESVR